MCLQRLLKDRYGEQYDDRAQVTLPFTPMETVFLPNRRVGSSVD